MAMAKLNITGSEKYKVKETIKWNLLNYYFKSLRVTF